MSGAAATMPDLACGAEVHVSASVVTWDDAEERYYFCSRECRRAFVDHLGDPATRTESDRTSRATGSPQWR